MQRLGVNNCIRFCTFWALASILPVVNASSIWLERTDATRRNPLVFRTKGPGIQHTLIPLYEVMDERYSVYLKNNGKA